MLQMLQANSHIIWLCFGGLLLAAELLGASGYLLWSGIAAALVGILTWLFPLSWEQQSLTFAVLTLLVAWLWWKWLSHRQSLSSSSGALNQRGKQLLGMQATVIEPMQNGFSRVKIGDSTWRVSATEALNVGDNVVVIGLDGITLQVKLVPSVTRAL